MAKAALAIACSTRIYTYVFVRIRIPHGSLMNDKDDYLDDYRGRCTSKGW